MLTSLGLDTFSEQVYRQMLAYPELGLPELAERLGSSVEEIQEAWDRLADLSLLRPTRSGSSGLHVVSPEVGLEMLLAREQAELLERQQQIERSRVAAAALIADHADLRRESPVAYVEQLPGVEAVRDRLRKLTGEVEHELLAFAPGGPQSAENLAAARPLDEELLNRGVRIRTLYVDSIRKDRATAEYASWLGSAGGQTRTVPSLPLRMLIVDRKIAVVPVNPERSDQGAVVLHGPGTVTGMYALFDQFWARGVPLDQEPGGDAFEELNGQEREVLALLADGMTDEVLCRRLGVSVRTARRIIAKLMDQLGARSRFQAGAEAVRRDWI
ncbi:helix-turn-helix domain-containing protein [Kitasatospora xanthocidica]|uniref:helix-turn-helix domain-containing protein n=1 Tax=Kitasatospora xanthocidica TaxID=83382 RepID=UPI0036EC0F82